MKSAKKYLLIAGIAIGAMYAVRLLGGLNVPGVSPVARHISGQ